MHPSTICKIHSYLKNLIEGNDPSAFLVIKELQTDKFVQFAGEMAQRLYFDLPSQILSKEEKEKAHFVLAAFNIKYNQWKNSQHGNFGIHIDSVDKALELVIAVMDEIYGFMDDSQFEFIES